MRTYYFVIRRTDNTKFVVWRKLEEEELFKTYTELKDGNLDCVYLCREDYADEVIFIQEFMKELCQQPIINFDAYIKKSNEIKELYDKFHKSVEILSAYAEREGEDVEISLDEECSGCYTTTGYDGDEYSRYAWVRDMRINEFGDVILYDDNSSDECHFSKFNKEAQEGIIKVFLKTWSPEQLDEYGD